MKYVTTIQNEFLFDNIIVIDINVVVLPCKPPWRRDYVRKRFSKKQLQLWTYFRLYAYLFGYAIRKMLSHKFLPGTQLPNVVSEVSTRDTTPKCCIISFYQGHNSQMWYQKFLPGTQLPNFVSEVSTRDTTPKCCIRCFYQGHNSQMLYQKFLPGTQLPNVVSEVSTRDTTPKSSTYCSSQSFQGSLQYHESTNTDGDTRAKHVSSRISKAIDSFGSLQILVWKRISLCLDTNYKDEVITMPKSAVQKPQSYEASM